MSSLSLLIFLTACTPTESSGSESSVTEAEVTADPVDDSLPADFSVANTSQMRAAVYAGTSLTYQLAYIGAQMATWDAWSNGACPSVEATDTSLVVTGGCTSVAGVTYTGSVTMDNVDFGVTFSVDGGEEQSANPTSYDPTRESTWTFDNFGMTPESGGGQRLFNGDMSFLAGQSASVAIEYSRAPDVAFSLEEIDCHAMDECADWPFTGWVEGLGTFDTERSADGQTLNLVGATTVTIEGTDDGCLRVVDGDTFCLDDEIFSIQEPAQGGGDSGGFGASTLADDSDTLHVEVVADPAIAAVTAELGHTEDEGVGHEVHDLGLGAMTNDGNTWLADLDHALRYKNGSKTAFEVKDDETLEILFRGYDEDGNLVACDPMSRFEPSDFDLTGCPE